MRHSEVPPLTLIVKEGTAWLHSMSAFILRTTGLSKTGTLPTQISQREPLKESGPKEPHEHLWLSSWSGYKWKGRKQGMRTSKQAKANCGWWCALKNSLAWAGQKDPPWERVRKERQGKRKKQKEGEKRDAIFITVLRLICFLQSVRIWKDRL